MNSSLNALVTNLAENYFKHLSHKFSGEFLKLVKQKGAHPFEYMNNF